MNRYIKYTICSLLLTFFCFEVNAQFDFSVSGVVVDEFKQPLPKLGVKILNATDSSFVKGTTSSDKGRFRVSALPMGNYIVSLSYLGYNTYNKNISLTPDNKQLLLGTIEMIPSDIMLSEAVVMGKTPDIISKEDTLEYNAASFKTQPNAVVEDMIKKMPGIEIDDNGKMTRVLL